MSLQKDLFRKKILDQEAKMIRSNSGLNTFFAPENDDSEEFEDLVSPLGFPSMPRPNVIPSKEKILSAIPWNGYFEENFHISEIRGNDRISFNVYYSPPSDPEAPIFMFHHGAGSSALTFALTAAKIQSIMTRNADGSFSNSHGNTEVAGILAFDMRNHGLSTVEGPGKNDMSLKTLSEDLLSVYKHVSENKNWISPPLILVGHSLGGAVASYTSMSRQFTHLVGACVVDAVEGPALEALSSMNMILEKFPPKFRNMSLAINWHLKSMSLQNREAASVSVPSTLKPVDPTDPNGEVTWITNLRSTEPYWKGWFTGLSTNFLKIPGARLLILAGTDRLDKELMVGQMQGKYQLVVFSESGHFIQEDMPDKTALTLIDFWQRNGKAANITPKFGQFRTE